MDGSGKLARLVSVDDILEVLTEEIQIVNGLPRKELPRSFAGHVDKRDAEAM